MTRTRLEPPARDALRRCLDAIDSGDRATAVDVARSLARDGERAARTAGVRLLYLLRLYEEALDSVRDSLRADAGDVYAHRLQYSLLKRLRFEQEAHAALGALLRVADDVRVHEAAALHFEAMGRESDALAHLERVLAAQTDAPHHYRTQLRLAIGAGDLDTARRAASRALQLDPSRWIEVVDRLLEEGLFELVEREANRRFDDPEGRALLGQLALYRGAASEASRHASHAFEQDPRSERALTVLVGSSILMGDLDRAERDLDRWSGALGPTLQTWRAELFFRRGNLEEARRVLTRVQNEVRDYVAAKLLWVMVRAEIDPEQWVTTSAYDGLLEGQLKAFGFEPQLQNGLLDARELWRAAADILSQLAGNRSPFPSVVRGGVLEAIRIPPSPRHQACDVQHRVRWIGLDRTKEEIVAELERIGPHPIAECYEAELYLWSGDYAVARDRFENILARARSTTWAWIGLGASYVLLGDPERALRTIDEGIEVMGWRGATLPVYRGEALFRLGRLDEAAEELKEACETQPGRVGAWVLRVLVEHARGCAEARDGAFAHLEATATAFLSDAARAAGIDGWWPASATPETVLRVTEQALALLRGNRSSSCPFWIAPGSGAIRSILYQRPVTTPAWEAEERRALRALL